MTPQSGGLFIFVIRDLTDQEIFILEKRAENKDFRRYTARAHTPTPRSLGGPRLIAVNSVEAGEQPGRVPMQLPHGVLYTFSSGGLAADAIAMAMSLDDLAKRGVSFG